MKQIYIASFDLGFKNFAYCIEAYDIDTLCSIKKPNKLMYKSDGTPDINTLEFISKIQESGTTINISNTDISDIDDNGKVEKETLCNLASFLDSQSHFFDMCGYIIIEKQMFFGNKKNPKAVKLQHFLESYFLLRYGRLCNIVIFPAFHKTRVLGAKKEQILGKSKKKWKVVNKTTRKIWAINTALKMLLYRGDMFFYETIDQMKKKDDVCDCLLQCCAFVVLYHEKLFKNMV